MQIHLYIIIYSVPLQAWGGPEGSRKLSFPDFMTTAQDGGKVVSLTQRLPLPPGNAPGTHFCQRLSRLQGHSAIGFYVNEKFQGHQLGSNQRPSDLQHRTITTVPPRSPHSINTRNKHHLHRPIANLSCFQKCASYSGIRIFNNLPQSITCLRNEKPQFKVALNIFLHAHAFYPVDEFFACTDDMYY